MVLKICTIKASNEKTNGANLTHGNTWKQRCRSHSYY